MKVDKLFAVLVVGGGMMVGCGGAPKVQPEAPSSAPTDEAPADEAPVEDAAQPASAPAADGEDGKCAWF